MASVDGTYWVVDLSSGKWLDWDVPRQEWHKSDFRYAFGSRRDAVQGVKRAGEWADGRIVRIRPRVSLATAVRRCVAARESGVELWFRRVNGPGDDYAWYRVVGSYFRDVETSIPCMFRPEDLLARCIVATPEDARRLDARGRRGNK